MANPSPTQKTAKSFEESLWDTATKLRGSVESSEYKHVVLSLIFLKFVSDKFEERRAELIAEGQEGCLDMVEWSGVTWTTRQGCPEGERGAFINSTPCRVSSTCRRPHSARKSGFSAM